MDINNVNFKSIDLDGIDTADYPDFVDAFICYAEYNDGTELSDRELDQLNDNHQDLVLELVYDQLF